MKRCGGDQAIIFYASDTFCSAKKPCSPMRECIDDGSINAGLIVGASIFFIKSAESNIGIEYCPFCGGQLEMMVPKYVKLSDLPTESPAEFI